MKSIKLVIISLLIFISITTLTTCDLFSIQPRANASDPNADVPFTYGTLPVKILSQVPSFTWINPDLGGDYMSTLVVRSHQPVVWQPTDGVTYTIRDFVDTDVYVIWSTTASYDFSVTPFYDHGIGTTQSNVYYKIFHFNSTHTYIESEEGYIDYSYSPSSPIENWNFSLGEYSSIQPMIIPGWQAQTNGSWGGGIYDITYYDGIGWGINGVVRFYGNDGGLTADILTLSQTITVPSDATTIEIRGSNTKFSLGIYQSNGNMSVYFNGNLLINHSPVNFYDFVDTGDISAYRNQTGLLEIIHPSGTNYTQVELDWIKINN